MVIIYSYIIVGSDVGTVGEEVASKSEVSGVRIPSTKLKSSLPFIIQKKTGIFSRPKIKDFI